MPPDLSFWLRLITRLAVEAASLVTVALFLERLIQPAYWRRALWQGTVICVLLLTASELSGLGRGLSSFLFVRDQPVTGTRVLAGPSENQRMPLGRAGRLDSGALVPVTLPALAVTPETVRLVWWPGLVWLAGVLLILGRVAGAQVLFVSLRRRRLRFRGAELDGRVAAILARLSFRRKICLVEAPGLTSPIAFGIIRPSVGLPADFAARFSLAEQNAMLAHELAHLAARDPLWYLLADLAGAVLWWHPQSWWARRRLHCASELAADEAASIFPEGPAALAECLVALGRQMTRVPGGGWMGVAGGGFRSGLAERVQRLLWLSDKAGLPSYGRRAHAAKIGAILVISTGAIALSGCLQNRGGEPQPTLQASLIQSWDASPAATVWHSTRAPESATAPLAPQPVKTQLVKPAGSAGAAASQVSTNPENLAAPRLPAQSDAPAASPGRQAIMSKLRNIRLSEMSYPGLDQGVPLTQLMSDLRSEISKQDAGHEGLTFVYSRSPMGGDLVVDPKDILVQINSPLTNVTVMQALDEICRSAQIPSAPAGARLVYSIANYAVIFSVTVPQAFTLYTRTFHYDPKIIEQGLERDFPQLFDSPAAKSGPGETGRTNDAAGTRTAHLLLQAFAGLGLDLTNDGRFIFINDRRDEILVRATIADLDTATQILEQLGQVPPEILLDVKFATFPLVPAARQVTNVAGFSFYLGYTTPNQAAVDGSGETNSNSRRDPMNPSGIFPAAPPSVAAANRATNAKPVTSIGILNGAQFRMVTNAIEQLGGSNLIACPRVTTESGRQARLADGSPGHSLDVVPTVLSDGYIIELIASPDVPPGRQLAEAASRIRLWDGQSAVLTKAPRQSTDGQAMEDLIFITPRIVDPAGNPVHPENELFQNSIPQQTE